MSLKKIVLGAAMASGIVGCAHEMIPFKEISTCRPEGPFRTCTGLFEKHEATYRKGMVEENPVCSIHVRYPESNTTFWVSAADKGCDGTVDIYIEGIYPSSKRKIERSKDNEKEFESKYDTLMQKVKDAVWKE